MTRAILLAMLCVPVVLTSQLPTRQVGMREPGGSCAQCSVIAERVAVFGSPDDKELIPDAPTFALLEDGSLVVGHQSGGPVFMYSPTGAFHKVLGRIGSGPGEYRNAKALGVGPGDSITILGSNAISVISVASGRGRSKAFGGMMPTSVLPLANGQFVINTHYGSQPAFKLFAKDFAQVSEFGPSFTPNAGGEIVVPIYAITPAAAGGFWAANREQVHRIERWTLDGRVQQRLDSTPPWWPRTPIHETESSGEPSRPGSHWLERPSPATYGIRESRKGHLWVTSIVADPKWKPVPNLPNFKSYEESIKYTPPADPDRHVDAMVEIFDAKAGTRLGTWRFHRGFSGMLGEGLVYRMERHDSGIWQVVLWRLTLLDA